MLNLATILNGITNGIMPKGMARRVSYGRVAEWRNGRRTGLKILFGVTQVRVRVPPRLLNKNGLFPSETGRFLAPFPRDLASVREKILYIFRLRSVQIDANCNAERRT